MASTHTNRPNYSSDGPLEAAGNQGCNNGADESKSYFL